MPRLMNDSDDDGIFSLHDEEHGVGKFSKQRAPDFTMHIREHERMFQDAAKRFFERNSEPLRN